jgi:hypothetical protein
MAGICEPVRCAGPFIPVYGMSDSGLDASLGASRATQEDDVQTPKQRLVDLGYD